MSSTLDSLFIDPVGAGGKVDYWEVVKQSVGVG